MEKTPAALQHMAAIVRSKGLTVTPGVRDGKPTFTISHPEDVDDVPSVTVCFARRHKQWIPTDRFFVTYENGLVEELNGGIMRAVELLVSRRTGEPGRPPVAGVSRQRSDTELRVKKKVIRI